MKEEKNVSAPVADEAPWLQRLYDRPVVLLVLGLAVMFGFYTIWGLYEVWTLPVAKLP